MNTHRLGREPLSARSPLHLRLILSAFGALVLGFGAVYAFTRSDPATGVLYLGGVSAVFAITASSRIVKILIDTIPKLSSSDPSARRNFAAGISPDQRKYPCPKKLSQLHGIVLHAVVLRRMVTTTSSSYTGVVIHI